MSIPFPEQEADSPQRMEDQHASWMSGVPRLTLPTRSIDQWTSSKIPRLRLPTKSIDQRPTNVKLKAVRLTPLLSSYIIDQRPTNVKLKAVRLTPLPSSYIVDVLPIDQQTTLIIPAIQIAGKTENAEAEKQAAAENYVSLVQRLVKSSGIYALASFASPLTSLVLAPFLTHNLSHADFGALTVLNTVIALVAGITQFGLNNAFFRAYSIDYEAEKDRLTIVSTVVILLTLSTVPVALAMIFAAPWISNLLLGSSSYSNAIKLAGLAVLMQNLTVPALSWLRAENRALLFSLLSIANLLIGLGANIFFVGVLHMGIVGSLIATAGGYAFMVVCSLPVIGLRAGLHIKLDIAWNLLSFGLPLVSSFVSVWVLQLADRYLLSRFGSLSETGSYGVAYTLGGVLGVLVLTPFSLAWPTAMFTIAKRKDAARVYQLVFRWFSIALLLAAYGLSLLSTILLTLFFPPAYSSAAPVIPVVALSTMFYGIYNIFTTGISVTRKTWYAVIFTTFAALINVGANIILIPLYGSIGAAEATLIAYVLLAVVAYAVNQCIYPIPFEIGKCLLALTAGIALYGGTMFLTQKQNMYISWAISFGVLMLYAACLALLGLYFTRRDSSNQKQKQEVFLP